MPTAVRHLSPVEVEMLAKSVAAVAPALREAGVLSLDLGVVSFTLRPPDPPQDTTPGRPDDAPEPANAFDDPASYPGGVVPGYGAPRDDED